MAVRRQRATTSKEIMEKDINIAIQKAKTRFRHNKIFYIFQYIVQDTYYFISSYPENDKTTGEEIYYQKWIFNEENKKWENKV